MVPKRFHFRSEDRQVVAPQPLAFNVRQAQLHQQTADVLVLELDGVFGATGDLRDEILAMLGVIVGLAQQLCFQLVEVIGYNEPDFALGPVLVGLLSLLYPS